MLAIEIRTNPQGTPGEGAFEDGNRLTVIGRKLVVGEELPDMVLWRTDRFRGQPSSPEPVVQLSHRSLLYTVNGFLTPVCEQEAKQCQVMVRTGKLPEGVDLYGLTNENLIDIRDWAQQNQIDHPLLSTHNSDAGIKLGLYIPEYGGALQRALFGVVADRIVYAEYVYDQGGPLPNFEAGIAAVLEAKNRP